MLALPVYLLKNIHFGVDDPEPVLHFREADSFLGTQAQVTARAQAMVKGVQYPLLQYGLKIDEHVAAADQVELVESGVGYQVVGGEERILL